jgi:hypothetical protein
VVVIAATTAVMTPAWAGSEGPAGMASGMASSMSSGATASCGGLPAGRHGRHGLHQRPSRSCRCTASTSAPTAAQVTAAANLIKDTDASLARYENVNTALAAGYTYRLATNGEEHLLYDGGDPAYQGTQPGRPVVARLRDQREGPPADPARARCT